MSDTLDVCNSYLEVDLGVVAANTQKVRRHIGPGVSIMPVLKGNAYATGLGELGRFMTDMCGADVVACAQVWEAQKLRQAGLTCNILVMGGVPFHNIPAALELDLMTPAYSPEYLELLEAQAAAGGVVARVHIKVDTGLGRIGVRPGEELEALCRLLGSLPHVEPVGIFTHFAESENPDRSYTLLQMARFRQALEQVRPYGFDLQYIHAFNTAAIPWLKDPCVTHVRASGIFLGYDNCIEPVNSLGLQEALTWRAFVTQVKTVAAGESLGYCRVFTATAPTRVATVSVGYGDGYSRYLAAFQGADFLVGGKRAPILAICMDQTFIDVTGIERVRLNDPVTLLGRDGDECISIFELQRKMGQTYLATLVTIQERVHRIYKR